MTVVKLIFRSFFKLVGDLGDLKDTNYADVPGSGKPLKKSEIEEKKMSKGKQPLNTSINGSINVCLPTLEFEDLTLDGLEVVATLGIGGFGRVALVQLAKDRNKTFALKCLKKKHIVDTQQQEHVYSEKKIMMACRHQYIAR